MKNRRIAFDRHSRSPFKACTRNFKGIKKAFERSVKDYEPGLPLEPLCKIRHEAERQTEKNKFSLNDKQKKIKFHLSFRANYQNLCFFLRPSPREHPSTPEV